MAFVWATLRPDAVRAIPRRGGRCGNQQTAGRVITDFAIVQIGRANLFICQLLMPVTRSLLTLRNAGASLTILRRKIWSPLQHRMEHDEPTTANLEKPRATPRSLASVGAWSFGSTKQKTNQP